MMKLKRSEEEILKEYKQIKEFYFKFFQATCSIDGLRIATEYRRMLDVFEYLFDFEEDDGTI